jgi:hypothetical protein
MVRRTGWLTAVAVMLAVAMVPPGVATARVDCSAPLPQGDETVTVDPADFVAAIDNPYWPMSPGSRWVYRETSSGGPGQRVVVTVKSRTKEILGIAAVVVHDEVTEDGVLVEDTYDWYAQDVCGNVWYLGENTKEFEDGHVVSTAGSWEAGVDDAQPGVIVPADPELGFTYRQEYLAGEAEDVATALSLDEQVTVPFGHFDGVRMTKETTALEPRLLEYKWYAAGVGPLLAIAVSGGSDREELVSFRSGG